MSSGVPFANGELGKTDFNFRRGDCASSAISGESSLVLSWADIRP